MENLTPILFPFKLTLSLLPGHAGIKICRSAARLNNPKGHQLAMLCQFDRTCRR